MVKHDNENCSFSYELEGSENAVLKYKLVSSDKVDFYSTVVPEEGRGQGIARKLVEAGLAWVDASGLKVIASCSYVAGYFEKNPSMKKFLVES